MKVRLINMFVLVNRIITPKYELLAIYSGVIFKVSIGNFE